MKNRFVVGGFVLAALTALAGVFPAKAILRGVPAQFVSAGGGGACASGMVDAVPASSGAYTFSTSFRKVRAAYAGSAMQLQKNVSGNPTQDIGFSGCDNDAAAVSSFCGA